MKKTVSLLCILLSIIPFCACGKATENNTIESTTIEYKEATLQNQESPEASSTNESLSVSEETNSVIPSTPDTTASTTIDSKKPQIQETQATLPATTPETTKKQLQKTGEMAFSDDASNKYMKAVVDKYGVDSTRLAAIYTVPDNNGNLVFEFDGSTDENGKLIRNESTLIAIYSVDKELNCKRASEDSSLNEYSYGEMKVMFITTKKHIMPEFQEELNGQVNLSFFQIFIFIDTDFIVC